MQNQFNQVVSLLQSKSFEQAIKLCQNLLQQNNHPQLHLFLAIAYGENNQLNHSKQIFETLLQHFPQNPDIYYNYALILQSHNFFNDSIKQYNQCISLQPRNASAYNNLGGIYRKQDDFSQALKNFQQALALQPNNLHYINNVGICLYHQKQFDKALPYLLRSHEHGQFEVEDCIALIDILLTLRKLKKATEICLRSIDAIPDNSDLYNLAGLIELEKRKFQTAIKLLNQSLTINPSNFDSLCHLASAYSFSGNQKECDLLLDRISEINTEPAKVFAAIMYENANKNDKSNSIIKNGLKIFPKSIELKLIQARISRKDKKYEISEEQINTILSKHPTPSKLVASVYFENGFVLEKLNKYSSAWESFSKANQMTLDSWQTFNPNKDKFSETCQLMIKSYKDINPNSSSTKLSRTYNGENLVFIIGFPRSGTTLLDSILSAHSDVYVLEEAPIIGETYDQIKNISPQNYATTIESLDEDELFKLREFYFTQLNNYSQWDNNGILVDKSPLNTMHAGFIYKLFPKAKIIFSVRHPMDVCLSCFFQDFKMNSFMTNFTNIESTAQTYNAMLDLLQISEDKYQIPIYYQRYEDLVNSFESEIRKLTSYLNLSWQDSLLSYEKNLGNRGTISNPSYNQVNQGIYKSSENKYKNYLPLIKNALSLLSAKIIHFKYTQ